MCTVSVRKVYVYHAGVLNIERVCIGQEYIDTGQTVVHLHTSSNGM